MSNAVFPSLPGLSWNVKRKPMWRTKISESSSGREYAFGYWSYPRYKYSLSFEALRSSSVLQELQTLAGFFNSRQGSLDTFLYSDPDDNAVTGQSFAVGDGVTKDFQLVRAFGGYIEPVFDLNTVPIIKSNGSVVVSGYTITSGLVSFSAAPVNGAVLSWDGTYYRRVRFTQDEAEFNKFMYQLWELKTLEFISVKP